MPFDGNGTFTPASPEYPAVSGTPIPAATRNTLDADFADGLTNALTRDGQSPPTADLPMGTRKLTGLAAGSAPGHSVRYEQLFSQGAEVDIASAATVDIGAQNTNFLRVTGAVAITSFGTNYNGPRFLRFAAALTLTHSATLVLPGGVNIVTAAGDTAIVTPIQGGGWQVMSYMRAAAQPLALAPTFRATRTTSQAIVSSVATKVLLPVETFDTNGFFDSGANSRFQPTIAGYYQINGAVYLLGTTITTAQVSLQKNGVEFASAFHTVPATGDHKLACSDVVYLNGTTDYVELWGLGISGAALNFATGSYMSGSLSRLA